MSLSSQMGRLVWGGDCERFHTHKTIRTETVHHHTAIVAHFATLLTPREWDIGSKYRIMCAVLTHDLGEGSNNGGGVCAAGDSPSPAKRAVPGLKEACDKYETFLLADDGVETLALTTWEYAVLKLADNMAGLVFCIQERWLGNKLAEYAYSVYCNYLYTSVMTPEQDAVFAELQSWWAQANS